MAMNKAEKKALEDLKTELALAWPRFEEPKPLTYARAKEVLPATEVLSRWSAGSTEQVWMGWRYNSHVSLVDQCAFDSSGTVVSICAGLDNETGLFKIYSTVNSCKGLYATEVDAYRAMIWEMSRTSAKTLRHAYARLEAVEVTPNAD